MNSTKNSKPAQPKQGSIPLWLGFVLALLVWEAIPWALSLLTSRYGWAAGYPGSWNVLGLILVAVGTTGLLLGLLLHSAQTPKRLTWAPTMNYLLQEGPYRYSRNPMYLSELTLMLGWVIFYGSIAVLIGFVVWWAFFNFYQVPQEERVMEANFGEAYRAYKNRVPRWLGKP